MSRRQVPEPRSPCGEEASLPPETLFVPGPVQVAPEVLLAQARPLPFHQDVPYSLLVMSITERVRGLLGAGRSEVFFCGSSGTGALEAALVNLTAVGDHVVVATNGQFGDRLVKMGQTLGCELTVVEGAWEMPLGAGVAASVNDRTKVLVMTHLESSTGVLNDIQTVARELPAHCLFVADCVSTVGTMPLQMDSWGVDVMVGVSGKALGATPGLAFMGVSSRALTAHAVNGSRSFYFDWSEMRDALARHPPEHVWTPPISIAMGLSVALEKLADTGFERVLASKLQLGRALRQGLLELGFDLFAHAEDWPSRGYLPQVVAARPPRGIHPDALVQWLWERRGIRIARGQGRLKGTAVRIAYFGTTGAPEIEKLLDALDDAVTDIGQAV